MLGTEITVIQDTETLKLLARTYAKRGLPVFLDTETTGLNPRQNKLITLQMMQAGFAPVVIDWRHWMPSWVDALNSVLPNLLVIGHNLKFDWQFLHAAGIKLGTVYCTKVAEQVILGMGSADANTSGFGLTLKDLAPRYGAAEKVSKEETSWFIDLDQRPEWGEPLPKEQLDYAAQDIRVLEAIYTGQYEGLEGRRKVLDIEMRCLPALALMEYTGIRVDADRWREFIATKAVEARGHEDEVLAELGLAIVQDRIEAYDLDKDAYDAAKAAEEDAIDLTRSIHEEALAGGKTTEQWGVFKQRWLKDYRTAHPMPDRPKLNVELPNLDSPAQLLTALQALGVPAESTDSEKLKQLEDDYPVVKKLTTYRKAKKFVTSFGETILERIEADGRIHPEYQQIGASTGRMSCTKPNWQQVPSRGDGKKLRQCVIAAPGNVLLTCDFSNIELRILAEYSQDARLLQMFADDVDLHSEVARLMFGLPADTDVKHLPCPTTPGWTYRDVAKVINYGLVYGMSSSKLGRTMRINRDDAAMLMDQYFTLFPDVVGWLTKMKLEGVEKLASYTMAGRVRTYKLPSLPGKPTWHQLQDHKCAVARVQRQSMNTPIQGTSADITKLALAMAYEDLDLTRAIPVAVVHDEIVVESAEAYAERASDTLALAMNDAAHSFLKTVALPWPEVSVAERWEKA